MRQDKLTTLCKRHHACLLNCDEKILTIAVVGDPSSELLEALRFATQKRIDIECWTQEQMDSHHQQSVEAQSRPRRGFRFSGRIT
jgi:protein transport protein HofB